jgi:mannose-6-phosphate isomerase-like protein (cupin superfamily)
MQRLMRSALALLFVLSISNQVWAQAQTSAPHMPRGTATDISNATIEALIKAKGPAVGDNMMRMVDVGPMNVGVAVLGYAETKTPRTSGVEHSGLAEVYYVMKGEATFVTGGTVVSSTDMASDNQIVKTISGPTSQVTVKDAVVRKVGPGDVIIVPPNTPHWASDVTSDIVFLVVRIDPKKLVQTK